MISQNKEEEDTNMERERERGRKMTKGIIQQEIERDVGNITRNGWRERMFFSGRK